MRSYVVQPGDSPAKIASQSDMAGCPKCARDLIFANPHKDRVTHPNGFVTFRDLRAGERLWLPDKWFSAEFETLPPSYFKALPYADGVTPGTPASTLGDADSLASAARVLAAAVDADPGYCGSVARPGTPVNTAVHAFKLAWNAENPTSPSPSARGPTSP